MAIQVKTYDSLVYDDSNANALDTTFTHVGVSVNGGAEAQYIRVQQANGYVFLSRDYVRLLGLLADKFGVK